MKMCEFCFSNLSIFRLVKSWVFIPFTLIQILLSSSLHSQTYQFNRIVVDVKSEIEDPQAEIPATTLDSAFAVCSRDIQELETLLGYKSSGHFHIQLFNQVAPYQNALQKHSVWMERFLKSNTTATTNHYPIFMGTNFSHIRLQMRYCLAHFVVNEFLNGSSIQQKMSRFGNYKIPNWFSQGFFAHWASLGWDVHAEAEYRYFQNKGSFKNINVIEPIAQQVYGRRIWDQIEKQYGKSAYSNLWFVVKYTSNLESAFEYLTGKTSVQWQKSTWEIASKQELKKTNELIQKNNREPILDAYSLSGSSNYLLRRYSSDFEIIEFYSKSKQKTIYKAPHARLTNDLNFPIVTIVQSASARASISENNNEATYLSFAQKPVGDIWQIDTNGNIIRSLKHLKRPTLTGVPNLNNSVGLFYSWGVAYVLSADLNKNIDQSLLIPFDFNRVAWKKTELGTEFSVDENTLSTNMKTLVFKRKLMNGHESIIYTDTAALTDQFKGFVVESNRRLSYLQSKKNQWYLHFIELGDSSNYHWKSEIEGDFVQQCAFVDHISLQTKIIELSYANNQSYFRIIEVSKITNFDLKELIQGNEIGNDNIQKIVNVSNQDSSSILNETIAWEYVSNYPKKDLTRKKNNPNYFSYTKDGYRKVHKFSPYNLTMGGFYLSNEDPLHFPYLVNVLPNQIYNHPLSPELRFYLKNQQNQHQIKIGLLSNLPMNRISVRFYQDIEIGGIRIWQEFLHRNRTFNQSDVILKQNSANLFKLGLSKRFSRQWDFGGGYMFQNDRIANKISRPFSTISPDKMAGYHGVFLSTLWSKNGNHSQPRLRYALQSAATVSMARYNLLQGGNGHGMDMEWKTKFELPIGKGMTIQTNAHLTHSIGEIKTQYWIGGSQGWIIKDQWNLDLKNQVENYENYVYRKFAGNVRGFLNGERLGSSSAVLNAEFHFIPQSLFGWKVSKSSLGESLRLYMFLDLGTSFIGASPGNPNNPFNTVIITSPNSVIRVTAKRNPWIAGSGLGVAFLILKMPIRYEMAWGLKEGKILVPIQHVCMTWNF